MSQHYPPQYKSSNFHCASCQVYAKQTWWSHMQARREVERGGGLQGLIVGDTIRIDNKHLEVSFCSHCNEPTLWLSEKIIFPTTGTFPTANSDLPDNVKKVYAEAGAIAQQSSRAACALLRLAVQMLLEHLGEKGSINDGIGNLVKKGLDPQIQQSLDIVRVTGNDAVHPGVIDVDDISNVQPLFSMINIIADALISQPKRVQETYDTLLPEKNRNAIDRRDKSAT